MKSIFSENLWKDGHGEEFVSKSPNDGKVVFSGNFASFEDCESVVRCAKAAQEAWFKIGTEARISFIRKFVEIVKERKAELAHAISVEVGKPKWEAEGEINSVINKLEPCVDAFKRRCEDIVIETAGGGEALPDLDLSAFC